MQSEDDRLADVFDMDERPPRRAVAGHPDLFGGPREPGQVVKNDVEAHTRASAECRGVAQEHRREICVGERSDIAFDQHLTFGISGLRIGRRLLVTIAAVLGRTIDTARRGIHKARDAGLLASPRQGYRAEVINGVSRALVQLAERVVRQLGQMHDRVEPFDVLWRYPAHVLGKGERPRGAIVVKPAIPVKAAINPDDVEPPLQQLRPENGADIPVDTGNEYPHSRHLHPKESIPEVGQKYAPDAAI